MIVLLLQVQCAFESNPTICLIRQGEADVVQFKGNAGAQLTLSVISCWIKLGSQTVRRNLYPMQKTDQAAWKGEGAFKWKQSCCRGGAVHLFMYVIYM